jgi:hypothetical protein
MWFKFDVEHPSWRMYTRYRFSIPQLVVTGFLSEELKICKMWFNMNEKVDYSPRK